MSSVGSNMSVSWRTDSPARSSSCNISKTTNNKSKSSYTKRKVDAISAKNSGMKFPSWREPKPLRTLQSSMSSDRESQAKQYPIIKRSLEAKAEQRVRSIVDRLSAPTISQKLKTVKLAPKTSMLNMNYYTWSNMAAYKDHQKTLYSGKGTMKKSYRKSSKR